MDPVISTLVELSARPDIAALAGDARAAWVFSADGARVLWSNAAGASFFSIRDAADLASLSGLTKSPARPHISRIAETGTTDRMSTDRLRFYRGLRVMLLTCHCKRLELGGGRDAALIVCGDKGLMSTGNPMKDYLKLLAGRSRSVFLSQDGGRKTRSHGPLSAWPSIEDIALGGTPVETDLTIEDNRHQAIITRFGADRRLAVASNTPAPALETPERADAHPGADGDVALAAAETGRAAIPSGEDGETQSAWTRAQDDAGIAPKTPKEPEAPKTPEAPDDLSAEKADAVSVAGGAPHGLPSTPQPPVAPEASSDAGFEFKARKRPVRFAWKMDLDQRFTFVSDEFAQTLGPASAEIVGMTWQEVRETYDIDGRGLIAHALNRRDTWSGKTVYWPVSGQALRVPVDMAALPAFDRDRKFEGYRGFGVCRTADVKEDPEGPQIPGTSALPAARPELDGGNGQEFEASPEAAEPQLEDDGAQAAPDAEETAQSADMAETGSEQLAPAEDTAPDTLEPETPEPETDDLAPGEPETDDPETHGPEQDEPSQTLDSEDTAPAPEAQHDLEQFIADQPARPPEPETPAAMDLIPVNPARTRYSETTSIGARASALLESLAPDASRSAAPELAAPSEGSDREEEPNLPDPDVRQEVEDTHSSTLDEGSQSSAEDVKDDLDDDAEAAIAEVEADTDRSSDGAEAARTAPAGISGPEALQPKDIETAVKSLAKSFEAKRRSSKDLFEPRSTVDIEPDQQAPDDPGISGETQTGTPTPGPEDQAKPEEHVKPEDEVKSEDRAEAEELEHDQQMESAEEPQTIVLDDDGGKVVPISDATPRLVPVDTSGLSRPDLAAFKKIAEALGARFEGDLADFDMIQEDLELDYVEPTPPPSGPIDPVLLDRLPIGIAIARDRDILYANETLLEFLGYPSLAALGEAGGLEALFADEEEDDFPNLDRMEDTVDGLMKARLADGSCRAVDARMHAVPWNGGRGLMISLVERPLTEAAAPAAQPRSKEDLESAQRLIAQMDTILETATDGVLVLSPEGTILKVNRSAEALFNANRADMIGQDLLTFLAPESHRAASDYLDGLARNGVASVLNDGREVLGQVANSGLVPLFMTIGRIEGEGPDRKLCAVLRDITQWKTAEEELTEAKHQAENASSQKSDFLAKISHEIRTPLNAIIGFSEVMMDERFGPINNDRYKEYLKDIRTSGAHIMSLINDLLDLSKIEAGKMDLRFTAVSLNDVVRECVALMQPQANRERVIIRASLPDAVPNVVADARSVRQIVLNLLSNAIKFNKSGGQAIVSTALDDTGEVVLRVRDTGTGMSAKELASAMEPFRQLHTTRNDSGSGLGLPLTKALVEANRANFQIDSTPDQGTMVEITFPTQRVLSE